MSRVLPAVYAGCAVLVGRQIVSHRTGYDSWREVRERVHYGADVLWRYGQACGNFTPAGVSVGGDYFEMRQP